MIDVSPYQLEIINNILEKHVPECEVRAFGSRATWTAKDYSDLDLVIVGKKKLPDKTIYALEEDFQESDLPFRVDVLDWNTISPEFRKVIEKGYVVLRKGGRMGGVTGEWEEYILFDLAKWKNGLAFKNINFSEKGIPVIKISELKYGITSQTQFTEQTFDIEYFLNKGDLLLSWSGSPETSIDTFWYSLPEGWLNQHIFKITIGKAVEKIFFYYLLKYLKPTFIEIARNKQTTGLGHVTIQDLKNIKVKIPELLQQKEIVKTLFALDNKIELNNQMNKTLEAIGQTLFKRWFVDFEFPDEEGK
ncbi:restriction endonuclease subunit S, partial [Candidatus Poribacteria bacterium]|nr:restriction endonuclease subunit S [Candidatus Poribacteria bacterium]